MRHATLFSGIGGPDLAAEWIGWENVFHCEWNPFGQRILKHYWPNSISYDDITKTDFTIHRGTIDVLTGGFPCQPYSMAGKRKGKDDERHLWPEMLRAIKEIRPRWVVGENVFGLVNWSNGLVFHEVQADLEAAGYEVWPYVLPACAVNAPHRRDRIWFVAYAVDGGHCSGRRTPSEKDGIQGVGRSEMVAGIIDGTSISRNVIDANSPGLQTPGPKQQTTGFEQYGKLGWTSANTNGGGRVQNVGEGESKHINQNVEDGSSSDANTSGRREGDEENAGRPSKQFDSDSLFENDANADGDGFEGGRESEFGEASGGQTFERRSSGIWDAWENFPLESPVCRGNDGIPAGLDGITFSKWRNESIKAFGNAIVPQVVFQIYKSIQQFEDLYPEGLVESRE